MNNENGAADLIGFTLAACCTGAPFLLLALLGDAAIWLARSLGF